MAKKPSKLAGMSSNRNHSKTPGSSKMAKSPHPATKQMIRNALMISAPKNHAILFG